MTNVPKLRFNGFSDDWEQRKLGETFDFLSNNTLSRAELSTETGPAMNVHYGDVLIKFGEYLDATKVTLPFIPSQQLVDKFKSSLLQDGDVIMADTAEDEAVGKCTEIAGLQGFPTISGLHTIPLRPMRSFAPGYLGYYMNSDAYHDQLLPLMQGIKVTSVSKSAILNTDILYPADSDEQARIGRFFIQLDTLITLHQRQCDTLSKTKKFFLQNLFPQKGETTPKIRFEGCTDAWELRKVLDLLIQPITDGPHETPELVEKGIPFISVDAIVDNKIDFNRKRGDITEEYNNECCKKYRPQLYDVYLVKSGSTVGKVAIVETTNIFNIWSPLAAMRCGDKTYPYFLYYLLQTKDIQAQVIDKASNGTQPNLSMRELEKFGAIVTANGDEQRLIGDYLRNLDRIITLHQRKIAVLKSLKQFMLQNLFPRED